MQPPPLAAAAIELQQAVIAVIIIKQCHRRSRGDPSKRGIGCVTTDMGICANRGIPLGRLSSGEKMNRSQNWSIAKKCCDADGKRERLHGAAVGMALGREREESHTLRHVISRDCPTCQAATSYQKSIKIVLGPGEIKSCSTIALF